MEGTGPKPRPSVEVKAMPPLRNASKILEPIKMHKFSAKAGTGLIIFLACCQCEAQTSPDSGTKTIPSTTEAICPPNSSPITLAEHFACFNDSFWSWKTVLEPAVTAGMGQWTGTNGFANNWSGFEAHYGANLAGDITGTFFGNFLMPSIFHEDSRYQPIGHAAQWYDRLEHVGAHLIHTRSDHFFNFSGVTSFAVSAGLSDLYEPKAQRTVGLTAERFGLSAVGYFAGDAFTEFEPDIDRLWNCTKKMNFGPCKIPKVVPVPPDSTIDPGAFSGKQQDLAKGYLCRGQTCDEATFSQQREGLTFSQRLEFAGATQGLANWCEKPTCQPGLEPVEKVNAIHGQGEDKTSPSADQFYLAVNWTEGSEQVFKSTPDWSVHWAVLHDGMHGYSENRNGDPFLGIVALFDQTEPVGQYHIGFRSIFDHYVAANADISQNYALYCEWYGAIKGFSFPCPDEKRNVRALQLTDNFVQHPTRHEKAPNSAEPVASESEFRSTVVDFLTEWYLDHGGYPSLKKYIAKDHAFAYSAIKWEIHTKAWHYKTSHGAWQDIFTQAFQPPGQPPKQLDQAIKFDRPVAAGATPIGAKAAAGIPLPDWRANAGLGPSPQDPTKNLYGFFDSRSTPQGTFFPKPKPTGPFLASTRIPNFSPRAQYLDHLRQQYNGRLKVIVYSVFGDGLVHEGVVLYWISEHQKWRLAAFQGTD